MRVKFVGVGGDDIVVAIALYPKAAVEFPGTDAETTAEPGTVNQTAVKAAEEAEEGNSDE